MQTWKIIKLVVIANALFAMSTMAFAATCERDCLLEQAKQFNTNMLAHTTGKIPLAPNAKVRENTKGHRPCRQQVVQHQEYSLRRRLQ